MLKNTSVAPPSYTIGKLAAAAGVNVETVRYYERRGLLSQPVGGSGYRQYGKDHLERLAFIRRAQGMGFSLDEVAELLSLNDMRDHQQARRLAEGRIADIRQRIAHLQQMESALAQLVTACTHGGNTQPCPIIDMAVLTHDTPGPAKACHPDSSR